MSSELIQQHNSMLDASFRRHVPREKRGNIYAPYGLGRVTESVTNTVREIWEPVALRAHPLFEWYPKRIDEIYGSYDFYTHSIDMHLSLSQDDGYGLTGLEDIVRSVLIDNSSSLSQLADGIKKNINIRLDDPLYMTSMITDYLSGENSSLFWSHFSDRQRRGLMNMFSRWLDEHLEIPQPDMYLYTAVGIHEWYHGESLAWAILSNYFEDMDEFDTCCALLEALSLQHFDILTAPDKTVRFLNSDSSIDVWQYLYTMQKYQLRNAKVKLTDEQYRMYCKLSVFWGWSEAAAFVSSRPFDILSGLANDRLTFDTFFGYTDHRHLLPEKDVVEAWSDHCTCEITDLGHRLYELSYMIFSEKRIHDAYEHLVSQK